MSTTNRTIIISETVVNRIPNPQTGAVAPLITAGLTASLPSRQQEDIIFFLGPADLKELPSFFATMTEKGCYYKIVLLSEEPPANLDEILEIPRIHTYRNSILTPEEYRFLVQTIFRELETLRRHDKEEIEKIMELHDIKEDQMELLEIGKALSVEKDQDKLLSLILSASRKITAADAGSIFLIEALPDGNRQLRFKYADTYSLEISYQEFVMPLNRESIAGYVAVTGEILNIPDVYNLTAEDPVAFNSSFDRQNNYRTKSMIVVPMRNHIDQIIGVIQLINSKEILQPGVDDLHNIRLETPEDFETKVIPFKKKYEGILVAIANQAAIAIENNLMIKRIRNQFEEFVRASVTAIESRDPATSGHSFRVASLCLKMAEAINQECSGVYKELKFSKTELKELEYAALLHDFGKVYIDTAIFSKAKKLFPKDFQYLLLKLEYTYRFIEMQYLGEELKISFPDHITDGVDKLEVEKAERLKELLRIKDILIGLNEPRVREVDPAQTLQEIETSLDKMICRDITGNPFKVLTEPEKNNLSIKRGSLNNEEREEIESHVIRSYNFVSKIPWPPEFQRIPEFTQKHHEKLDGSGYPYGIKDENDIPLQARMIAIADIFDALNASDRPYKKALPLEKSLMILQEEADHNKIDKHLLEIFLRYKIYENTSS